MTKYLDDFKNSCPSMTVATAKDKRSAPIGLFDSGMGGLSVFMHLKRVLPNEHYIYYADTLNVPYGPRSSEDIKQLSLNAIDWLIDSGCKLIVIACNSASAYALKQARQKYPETPIVGLVPALKPAVLNSQTKNVAVMATQATLEGILLNTVITDYAIPADVNVIKWFEPSLVPWVESGMPIESVTARRLKNQLHWFAKNKVDHLVLGCTHYPFFRKLVTQEVASHNLGIQVVDSGTAIATRVQVLLQHHNLCRHDPFENDPFFAATSDSNVIRVSVGHITTRNGHPLSCISNIKSVNFVNGSVRDNDNNDAQLAFYATDTESDLEQLSIKVQRLINS